MYCSKAILFSTSCCNLPSNASQKSSCLYLRRPSLECSFSKRSLRSSSSLWVKVSLYSITLITIFTASVSVLNSNLNLFKSVQSMTNSSETTCIRQSRESLFAEAARTSLVPEVLLTHALVSSAFFCPKKA